MYYNRCEVVLNGDISGASPEVDTADVGALVLVNFVVVWDWFILCLTQSVKP